MHTGTQSMSDSVLCALWALKLPAAACFFCSHIHRGWLHACLSAMPLCWLNDRQSNLPQTDPCGQWLPQAAALGLYCSTNTTAPHLRPLTPLLTTWKVTVDPSTRLVQWVKERTNLKAWFCLGSSFNSPSLLAVGESRQLYYRPNPHCVMRRDLLGCLWERDAPDSVFEFQIYIQRMECTGKSGCEIVVMT